jgi:hypothetical protein
MDSSIKSELYCAVVNSPGGSALAWRGCMIWRETVLAK